MEKEFDLKCRQWHYCQVVSNSFDDWQFCNDNSLQDFESAPFLSIEQLVNHDWYAYQP